MNEVTTPEWVEVTTVTKAVEWVEEHEFPSHELMVTTVVVWAVVDEVDKEPLDEAVVDEIDPYDFGVVEADVTVEPGFVGEPDETVVTDDDEPTDVLDDEDSVAVNGHQVVYSVTIPTEVVVAMETKAGEVVSLQSVCEQEVTVTIVVSFKTLPVVWMDIDDDSGV